MNKFTTDIAAEIQMRCDLGDKISQLIIPSSARGANIEYRYYEMRRYTFALLDGLGLSLEETSIALNIHESVFINWQLNYLNVDLRSLSKLETYLETKLIKIYGH